MEANEQLFRLFSDVVTRLGRAIPERFTGFLGERVAPRPVAPASLPCLRWLPTIAADALEAARPMAFLLQDRADAFCWRQTYGSGDFGQAFLDDYGWLEVFGARGPFAHDRIAGGLLLLGPDTLYPDHRHLAEEIYVPFMGGTSWRHAGQAFQPRQAGEVIHHPSNVFHAMQTASEPLLALYLWRGGPLDQRSEIAAANQPENQTRSG